MEKQNEKPKFNPNPGNENTIHFPLPDGVFARERVAWNKDLYEYIEKTYDTKNGAVLLSRHWGPKWIADGFCQYFSFDKPEDDIKYTIHGELVLALNKKGGIYFVESFIKGEEVVDKLVLAEKPEE